VLFHLDSPLLDLQSLIVTLIIIFMQTPSRAGVRERTCQQRHVSLARHGLECCLGASSPRHVVFSSTLPKLNYRNLVRFTANAGKTDGFRPDPLLGTVVIFIQPVKSVRDLGVHLDSELTMTTHISKIVSSYFYQLRRIRQVRRLVGQDVTR